MCQSHPGPPQIADGTGGEGSGRKTVDLPRPPVVCLGPGRLRADADCNEGAVYSETRGKVRKGEGRNIPRTPRFREWTTHEMRTYLLLKRFFHPITSRSSATKKWHLGHPVARVMISGCEMERTVGVEPASDSPLPLPLLPPPPPISLWKRKKEWTNLHLMACVYSFHFLFPS